MLKVIKRDCTEVDFDNSKIVNAIIKAKRFLNSVFCIKGISPDILESIAISAKQKAENTIKHTPFFKLSFSIE